jgi:D-lactate dehydrogenase (cytochrome)
LRPVTPSCGPRPEDGRISTSEHGAGTGKMKFLEKEHGAGLMVMSAIKKASDPFNIFNPGKIIAFP